MRLAYTLAFVMLLDSVSTVVGMSLGIPEGNLFMAKYGIFGIFLIRLVAIVVILGVSRIFRDAPARVRRVDKWLRGPLNLIQGVVVSWNISLLILSKGV